MLEARIASLEEKLRSATVIDQSDLGTDHGARRLGRPRQGRRRQVHQVHDRRLGRGQPGRGQALQRVAGRQGAARPQARRRGRDHHAPGRAALKITKIDVETQVSSRACRGRARPTGSRGAPGRRAGASSSRCALPGIDPFPHEFDGVEPIAAVRAAHAGLEPGEETDARHRVAGRLAARRGQGKMAFLDLVDRSGRIQLQARVDVLGARGDGAAAGAGSRRPDRGRRRRVHARAGAS